MPTPEQWKLWRQKRTWYERNSSRSRSRRLDRHAAAYARPVVACNALPVLMKVSSPFS